MCFLSFLLYKKLRPIFCSVRSTQYTQSSRNEDNKGRWFFSHWQRRLWGKTSSTPDRRPIYGLLITSPDVLPRYRIFFGARDTRFTWQTSCNITANHARKAVREHFLKVSLVLLYNNYSSNEIELNFSW